MTIIRAENADKIHLFVQKTQTKYNYSCQKRKQNRLLGINMLNLVKSIFLKELYKVS